MTPLPPGIADWCRLPGPQAVLDAVRLRARRGRSTDTGRLSVALTDEQRREVGLLLGTPWEASGRAVRLQDLNDALAEHHLSARGLIEILDGKPIEPDRARRERQRASAITERDEAASMLRELSLSDNAVTIWLEDPGLPRAGSGELVALTRDVARVWRRLPPQGTEPIRLAVLAATTSRNAHDLDHRTPLGRAVARLAAAVHGLSRPTRGRAWRAAWESIGVRCDEVSSRVLALNLPLEGSAPAVQLCHVRGEPVWLTLRSLTGDWFLPPGTKVFVCENPTVAEAAADTLGAGCTPLVCTDGTPSGAALDLVAGLASSGALLSVRADFDEAGLTIVEQIRRVVADFSLWRYDGATYLACLGRDGLPEAPATLDEALSTLRHMHREEGVNVHEEYLLSNLLVDLKPGSAAG